MPHPKGLIIILDGLGDRPMTSLQGATPLEAAHTPNLNALAARGVCGLMHPLARWVPVGTQVGVGLLLGLPPADLKHLARGPIEAAGAGLDVKPSDVALRCNFATIRSNGSGFDIVDRRAGRIKENREALVADLNGMDLGEGVTVTFRATTGHRAVAVLSGEPLSGDITDTDPGAGSDDMTLRTCRALDPGNAAAVRTANAVNAFTRKSHAVLHDHASNAARVQNGLLPANGILMRGAGQAVPLRNQLNQLGIKTAVVTGERTAVGLGRLFGFTVVHEPCFTALPNTDLDAKVRATLDALETHDAVFLHIKAPDVLAHDLDPVGKKEILERIDAALGPLLRPEYVIAVTGDHSCDSALGRHIGDPLPSCMAAPHMRRDPVQAFAERTCANGGLGHLTATDFLCAILDHMDRLPIYRPHHYVLF